MKNTFLFIGIFSLLIIIIILLVINIFMNKNTNNNSNNTNHTEAPPIQEEKTPLELAKEEEEKLKQALINEGYTTYDNKVYEQTIGKHIYTFSFNNYSIGSQNTYDDINLSHTYYLLTNTAEGHMICGDNNYGEVVNYTYDFNNNQSYCLRVTPRGSLSCTYYTSLQSLKSYFVGILNKHNIDINILLYNK